MMVVLPLRSLQAVEQSNCQEQDQASHHAAEHHWDHERWMPAEVQHESAAADICCCCESSISCFSDCGMSVNTSIIMQHVLAVAISDKSSIRTQVENSLLFRELTPPIRPPAYL
jgi:hypothetical protein